MENLKFIPSTVILYKQQLRIQYFIIFDTNTYTMSQWKCIIVDDEDVDRLMVVSFAKRFPTLSIVGIYSSPKDALLALAKEKIDIVFLDIDMPGINGIEFRKKALEVPVCIYISGHSEFAAASFELEALDFIVKPLRFERFERTMQRIEHYFEIKEKAQLFELSFGDNSIYIKEGNEKHKLNMFDILYLEALKDYTLLVTAQKKHCVWSNLGSLLKQESFQLFIRIHKSYAVQKQFVLRSTSSEIVLSNDAVLPIGRNFKENVKILL